MIIEVIGKSDRWVFVGKDIEGEHYVFSLDDSREIELGDQMQGEFTDAGGLFKEVTNKTKSEKVKICVETWGCNRKVAFEFLERLNSPTKIWKVKG